MNPPPRWDWQIPLAKSGAPAGPARKTGDQLDDFLEIRAAKVETGGGPDSTTISLSCLKGDSTMSSKSSSICCSNRNSAPTNSIWRRKQADDSISRRNDEIGEIAAANPPSWHMELTIPTRASPNIPPSQPSLARNLLDWHKTYVHPNNIILGISGDFDPAAMEAKLHTAFDSWPKGADLPKDKIAFHPASPRLLPHPKRRCEPSQHSHADSRHHAQQPRLLRHLGFQ